MIPFVLLLNCSGYISWKSRKTLLQDLRVQGGDAVDRVAADDGEVGHADPLLPPSSMSDMRRSRSASPGKRLATSLRKRSVDLVDDLEVARQDPAEQVHRPPFQRLGHDRVVRVAECTHGRSPRPSQPTPLIIEQDPHQFGDRQRRVGVVELDRHLPREVLQLVLMLLEPAEDVLEGGGDQEVFLPQPQFLAAGDVVPG